MSIKILLVDDHQIMREGLRALLEKAQDIEVVSEAITGREAVEKSLDLEVDVVVMDLNLPEMSGIEATKKILEIDPDKKILALSMLDDKSCVVESLKAGVKGYLVKNCAAKELIEAIRTLAGGEFYLCRKITNLVVEDYTHDSLSETEEGEDHQLTERELEVLCMIADGQTTKEIAFALNVSSKTIDVHRGRIMKKLALSSIAELTKYAVRNGLTSLD